MATFVIFWAALLAIIFFLLSVVTKGIFAVLMGTVEVLGKLLIVIFYGGGAALLLYLLASVVQSIMDGTFWSAIGSIILFIIVIGIIGAFIGGLLEVILVLVASIAVSIAGIVLKVFGAIYSFFEFGYAYFLKVIMIRLGMIVDDGNTIPNEY